MYVINCEPTLQHETWSPELVHIARVVIFQQLMLFLWELFNSCSWISYDSKAACPCLERRGQTWRERWSDTEAPHSLALEHKTESPQVLRSICPKWARRLHHTEKPLKCNCQQNNISSDCVIFGREYVYTSAITLARRLIYIYIDNIVHCTLQQYGTIISCRFCLCRIIFDLNMWKQLLLLTSKLTTFDLLVKLRSYIV